MGMVIRLRCRHVCLAHIYQSFSPWQLHGLFYMFFEAFGAGMGLLVLLLLSIPRPSFRGGYGESLESHIVGC